MAPTSLRSGRRRASAPVVTALALAAVTAAAGQVTAPSARAESTATASPAAVAFSDGFEDQTGTTPSGNWSTAVRDCSGTGTATVDSTKAHSGTKSVRIDGKTGYCNHAFVGRDISSLAGGPLYVRFWINHSTPLPPLHVAFAAMKDANDGGKDLRMGGQNQALQWNRESDDATLPAQSPVGISKSIPLPTNTWTCIEYGITGGNLTTWVNGSPVEGLIVDGTPTPDVDQQWLARGGWSPRLQDLRLGWESYAEGDDVLWFDDVAAGDSRIGC